MESTQINKRMEHTYILGLRTNGSTFRPSNWVERIAATGALYENKRLRYSKHLIPCTHNGILAIKMSSELDPDITAFILNFAKLNELKVIDEKVIKKKS